MKNVLSVDRLLGDYAPVGNVDTVAVVVDETGRVDTPNEGEVVRARRS